jgi:hypothetical protein
MFNLICYFFLFQYIWQMRFSISFLFVVLFFVVSTTKAQDTIITNVIVFDKTDLKTSSDSTIKKTDKISQFKNAIKLNPLLFLRGELPVYYERVINKNFSLEVAIGVTFKDYLGGMFEEISSDDFGFMGADVTEKMKANLSYKFGVRFFPSGYALDGVYFSLEFAKRNYDMNLSIKNSLPEFDPITFTQIQNNTIYTFNEQRYHNELKFIYGENEFFYWDNSFLDFYIGAGIDFYSEKKVKATTDNITNKQTYTLESSNNIVPKFYLGVKYGFVF